MNVDETRTSLRPVVGTHLRVLVLGSMPGEESRRIEQYYAHKRNRFWRVMGDLLGFDPTTEYAERIEELTRHGVGLWDVLRACERHGSLDSKIRRESEVPNAIGELVQNNESLALVALNGGKAAEVFHRRIAPVPRLVNIVQLPSTSPANAAVPYDALRKVWGDSLMPYLR